MLLQGLMPSLLVRTGFPRKPRPDWQVPVPRSDQSDPGCRSCRRAGGTGNRTTAGITPAQAKARRR